MIGVGIVGAVIADIPDAIPVGVVGVPAGVVETQVTGVSDLVIVEGAGSPAEVNLRGGDIANMGFAVAANLPVVIVGDIDRGGVIASLVGTHAVLPAAERERIHGFIVNKFRGDVSLFAEGVTEIERRTGWPSLGVGRLCRITIGAPTGAPRKVGGGWPPYGQS